MIPAHSLTALLLAYLTGSIPTAVWLGKIFYGIDIREFGSGNAGATNTFRVLGKKAGIPVMLIDILKGFAATNLAFLFSINNPGTIPFINFQLALGIAAVMGHIFPVYAGFRGGKGIATLFGMILAIQSEAALYCVLVFVVMLLLTKYVSLSSMMASFTYPIVIIFVIKEPVRSVVLFGICVCVLVLITHQKNIERLLKRKEGKTYLFKKKVKGSQ
ncbi:MAG TPA: glycerol-3-phosphate 1-O-acyltransferase PlsY [Anseongella sp.]